MSVCGDKVCEAKTKACCESIIASICGDRGLDFPTSSCKPLRLEGVADTTINQGVGIDLTDGIHAYDGNGDEIPFEVEPDTIDKCDVGEHLVKYTASGQGASMRPSLCGDNALAVSDACNDLTTIEKDRIVTITQANPPTINGIDMEELPINSTFDPTEGVSAVDDNGNIIPYEYSGTYDKEASGEIASFETEYAQSAKSLEVALEPIQSGSGTPSPDNARPISGRTEVVTWNDPVYGGAIEWNQLANPSNYISGSYTRNGIVKTRVSDGDSYSFNLSGTKTTDSSDENIYSVFGTQINIYLNHLYLLYTTMPSRYQITTYGNFPTARGEYVLVRANVNGTTSGSIAIRLNIPTGTTVNDNIKINIFDLTQMFGEGNEPTSADEFRALFPHDYYEYNSGETTCVSAVNGDEYRTYTTALGRTVYGGDVEQVGGQLTDKMGITNLGTLTWYYDSANQRFTTNVPKANGWDNLLCSGYALPASKEAVDFVNGCIKGFTSSNQIAVKDTRYTDATSFKTAVNGIQLCYELATPQTYQLTPQEISLLQGTNNVWSDGDVTVMYSANIPQGEAYEYIDEDVYRVYYTAEDECGNKTEATRIIVVGDGNNLCNARICNAFIECD